MSERILRTVIVLTIGSVVIKFLTGDSWEDTANNWFAMVIGAISVWFDLYMNERTR